MWCPISTRRGYEVRLSLCPPVEDPVLVPLQGNCLTGQAHFLSLECNSRQVVHASSGDPNRVVSFHEGVQSLVLQVGQATDRPLCHQVQQQTAQVCVSGSASSSMGGRCLESAVVDSGGVCLSTSLSAGKSSIQSDRPRLSQDDFDSSRLAQHVMVLGPGHPIKSGSIDTCTTGGSGDSTLQWDLPPRPSTSESACMAPRASTIQEQGFSDDVATRIEVPQRSSTRAVSKSKWPVFVKWGESNQVDFRSPSVTQVADFLMHLFQDRKLQPSTIGGYRTAIADMVGTDRWRISKDENLTRLVDSFHQDKPKGRRGVPSWNLSLVLHQLTKAPFEPMRKASLKHLTFKTVFFLALGSGKRRSEIHAWLYKNI